MSKKNPFNDVIGNMLEKSPAQEMEAVEDKPKVGRPRTIDRKITKSSQEGLPVNETRYTVIIKEDLLAEVKAYKDDSGKSMKLIVDEAFRSYIERMKEENQ